MGLTTSKATPASSTTTTTFTTQSEKFQYLQDCYDDRQDQLQRLSNNKKHSTPSPPNQGEGEEDQPVYTPTSITIENLKQWSDEFNEGDDSVKNQISLQTLNQIGCISSMVKKLNLNDGNLTGDVWTSEVETFNPQSYTATNNSGASWLYTALSLLDHQYVVKFDIKSAGRLSSQLSYQYLLFYDKLERSNHLLSKMIETSDFDLNSRVIQHLLNHNAGHWDMLINLITKYGLVPSTRYPDLSSGDMVEQLDYLLIIKLKEFSLSLRSLVKDEKMSFEKLNQVKDSQLKQIFDILCLVLGGVPPRPRAVESTEEDDDVSFVWQYKDQSNESHRMTLQSPLEFLKLIDYETHATKCVTLSNDPRNKYETLYTIDKSNNMVQGQVKHLQLLNVDIEIIKKVILGNLKEQLPVFVTVDNADVRYKTGTITDQPNLVILDDSQTYDHSRVFNVELCLSKEETLRLQSGCGTSSIQRAMIITGVNVNEGIIEKFKLQDLNSGLKYIATEQWVNQHLYQIVSNEKFVPKYLLEVWSKREFTVLPVYDPMGSWV